MLEELPRFKYHPDPIKTGVIEKSDAICPCCNKARGYTYAKSIWAKEEIVNLCPWCIASGEAARKFNGSIGCSPYPSFDKATGNFGSGGGEEFDPLKHGLSKEIAEELQFRTPGYWCLQEEVWPTCCDDICAFHGEVTREHLLSLTREQLAELDKDTHHACEFEDNPEDIEAYEPDGRGSLYHFVCIHCGKNRYHMDFD
jgi:uncharacterized protein CbrC (UPF0167 family)